MQVFASEPVAMHPFVERMAGADGYAAVRPPIYYLSFLVSFFFLVDYSQA
jgi:hypothetical protein